MVKCGQKNIVKSQVRLVMCLLCPFVIGETKTYLDTRYEQGQLEIYDVDMLRIQIENQIFKPIIDSCLLLFQCGQTWLKH